MQRCIKPVDSDAILKALHETRRIITVEDHNVIGGLGSAVAEVLAGSGKSMRFCEAWGPRHRSDHRTA